MRVLKSGTDGGALSFPKRFSEEGSFLLLLHRKNRFPARAGDAQFSGCFHELKRKPVLRFASRAIDLKIQHDPRRDLRAAMAKSVSWLSRHLLKRLGREIVPPAGSKLSVVRANSVRIGMYADDLASALAGKFELFDEAQDAKRDDLLFPAFGTRQINLRHCEASRRSTAPVNRESGNSLKFGKLAP